MQGDYEDYVALTGRHHFQLARTETISSVSTNATAPNLPGPGRTVGLLFDRLGAQVEKLLNIGAHRRGLGPKAVAQEIRHLLRCNETAIVERHAGFAYQFTDKEEKALRRLCKRLLEYARHRIRATQFQALEEIVNITTEDPLARLALARFDFEHYLTSKYREHDLCLKTSKALESIQNEKVHNLWSGVLLGRIDEFPGDVVAFYARDISVDPASSFDGIRCLRRSSSPYSRYICSLGCDLDKIHCYFRELRMSLRVCRSARKNAP